MAERRWCVRAVILAAAAIFLFTSAFAVVDAARRPPVSWGPPAAGAAPAQQPAYVGEDTCLTCHSDMARGYHDSGHGRAANPRAPKASSGCESCHGPGGAHIEDPAGHPMLRFAGVAAEEANQACLTCHLRGDQALWEGSAHDARNLSCVSCHSIHNPRATGGRPHMPRAAQASAEPDTGAGGPPTRTALLTSESEMELCAQCHRDKIVKLDRSGHMPVREGKMQCSSCHNPHGSMNVRLLRAGHSVNEACARCHADKRGPFLWEHAPVTESCTTCHDPHGSANERMLISKLPMLCQRCHIHTRHPSTVYDAAVIGTSNRLYARSCVTCHANIHGSNHASGNMFLR